MEVDGARIAYVDQGSGEPIVLMHGGTGDYRAWNPHRPILAGAGYRAISYSLRYFGIEPWSESWPTFCAQLHASDLAVFLKALNAGPVHLATWSYSGQVALSLSLDHPELVRSVFVFEPTIWSFVTDPEVLRRIQDFGSEMLTPARVATERGDGAAATREFINGVAGQGPDYFSLQPEERQHRQLDNSRVLPLMLSSLPRQITCAQLASIKLPVAVVQGGSTMPYFALIAEAAAGCMPAAKHIVVPGAGHQWPGEEPAAFCGTLIGFLKSCPEGGRKCLGRT
jgi:pimeloyl-ACP methyl ester carboxylesterase